MGLSPTTRWKSSERIAFRLLEQLGYKITEVHHRITIKGVDVAEVDAIAMDTNGNKYAVEVKAGKLDVTGIRQAYTNAKLLGMKPLIICKGFVDEAAKMTAEELGVKVITLSDYYIIEPEELEVIIKEVIDSTINDIMAILLSPKLKIKPEDHTILKALAEACSFSDAAKNLNITLDELIERIVELKKRGIIPYRLRSFSEIQRHTKLILYRIIMESKINHLLRELEEVNRNLRELINYLKGNEQ